MSLPCAPFCAGSVRRVVLGIQVIRSIGFLRPPLQGYLWSGFALIG